MNFNEWTNTFLYKNMYLSHFILNVSIVCEKWVETGTDCYIDPTSSPDHSSTSSASWLGLLNQGSLRATALSQQAGLPLPNQLNCFCHFFHLFTQVHLWLMARSRVNIQHKYYYLSLAIHCSVSWSYLIHQLLFCRYDPWMSNAATPGQSRPGRQWQWRGTLHSPKLQSWSLTIRLFRVISRTHMGGVGSYSLSRKAVGIFYSNS